MINRHSSFAHSAYLDLISSLRDDVVTDIRGAPNLVKRAGRGYWYDTYRVGSDVKRKYIGEDTKDLRDRLQKYDILRTEKAERRKERARLVRLLRGEQFMSLDSSIGSLLSAMADAGVFRLGGTIVGTHAFRLYEGELGVRYSFNQTAQTDDLDIASFTRLSISLEDTTSPDLTTVLKDFSFEPALDLKVGSTWRWRQTRGTAMVEFLTPSFEEEEGRRNLPALGVNAQALHHLNYLIAEPIHAAVVYRSGVLVQIPRPERFALHKLIVADRRRTGSSPLKAHKDQEQAAFLIKVLGEDRPDDLMEAYEDLLSRGPAWRTRIERSLSQMPETSALISSLASGKS